MYYILDVHTYNMAFNLQSSETSVKTRDNFCVSGDVCRWSRVVPDPQRPKVTSESQKCQDLGKLALKGQGTYWKSTPPEFNSSPLKNDGWSLPSRASVLGYCLLSVAMLNFRGIVN